LEIEVYDKDDLGVPETKSNVWAQCIAPLHWSCAIAPVLRTKPCRSLTRDSSLM